MPTDSITRVLFDSMKGDVINEIALFQLRKDFEEQTSQIITRLDDIEREIKTIKKRLGPQK